MLEPRENWLCFLFCGLLDDAFSHSEYIPSGSRVMSKSKGCGSEDDFV